MNDKPTYAELERRLIETTAACAAMRALLSKLRRLVSSYEELHDLRIIEVIGGVLKGQEEATRKSVEMPSMHSGKSQCDEQVGTSEIGDADKSEDLSRAPHREGASQMEKEKGVEQEKPIQGIGSSKGSCSSGFRETKEAVKLSGLRTKEEPTRTSRELLTSALRDLGVLKMPWTQAQEAIADLIEKALQPTAGAELLAEQDALKAELKEAIEDRDDAQTQFENERNQRQKEVGAQEYRGNTVSYIYDKCANYGRQFDNMRARLQSERELADRLGEALNTAHRQWRGYAESDRTDEDLQNATHAEARMYQHGEIALSEWREARK
jgi:hypothetical protein